MTRTPYSEIEWNDKPVTEMQRDELLSLVETLWNLVAVSAANFDLLAHAHQQLLATHEAQSIPEQRRH